MTPKKILCLLTFLLVSGLPAHGPTGSEIELRKIPVQIENNGTASARLAEARIRRLVAGSEHFYLTSNRTKNRLRITASGIEERIGSMAILRVIGSFELIPGNESWGRTWWVYEAGSWANSKSLASDYLSGALDKELEPYLDGDGLAFLLALFALWDEPSWSDLDTRLERTASIYARRYPQAAEDVYEGSRF